MGELTDAVDAAERNVITAERLAADVASLIKGYWVEARPDGDYLVRFDDTWDAEPPVITDVAYLGEGPDLADAVLAAVADAIARQTRPYPQVEEGLG